MVEAMAPGTTETPQPTPAVGTDSSKEQAWGVAVVVQDHIVNPSTEAAQAVAETVQSKVESVTAPVPNPEAAPAEAAVPTPKEEVNAEAVLPVPVEETSTAPIVPVPVLPLTAAAEAPATNGQAAKPLDTEIVDGAATIETKSELSTHSPAVVPDVQPSTHTPIVNGSVPSAEPASATETGPLATTDVAHDAPSTHSPVVLTTRKYEPLTPAPLADAPTTVESKPPPITNGVNGSSAEKPTQIDLPAPTQPSVLAPGTPAINGKPAETPSATSSPPNSPRKDRKGAFPTFGRHHRQSSSASVSTSGGTPDEHGSVESPSRKGTMKKKRTSSFFGKVKHIFSDDSKKNKDSS
ncbi:hypothetical protein BC835DRAFT_624170 [Cytidiella melzeri]|nr:hypothetical protein BC835DRAFT_624170 [Cytidiella melzeri]